MEGAVNWAQLVFVGLLVVGSFGLAFRVLFKLTDILVQMERLATRDDLSAAKSDLYGRMDMQWNSWQTAHTDLRDRVSTLEGQVQRMNGGSRLSPS